MDIGEFTLGLFSLEGRNAVVTGGNTGLGRAFSAGPRESRRRRLRAEHRRGRRHDSRRWSRRRASATRPRTPTSRSRERPGASSRGASRNSGRSTSSSTARACARSPRSSSSTGRQWDATVAVNLTAAFEMSYEAARKMVPQRSGKIINICSVFTFLGGRLSPAYAATKHGLAGLTKAYCDELARAQHPGQRHRARATTRPPSRRPHGAIPRRTGASSSTFPPAAGATRATSWARSSSSRAAPRTTSTGTSSPWTAAISSADAATGTTRR